MIRKLFFILIASALMFSCTVISQEGNNPVALNRVHNETSVVKDSLLVKYPFINYQINQIQSFSSKKGLASFYQKLDSMERGFDININIVHIGGSHVQAGRLTSAMRNYFDNLFINSKGERGFVFPSRIIKSNGPDYTKIEFSGDWKYSKSSIGNNHGDWGIAGQYAKLLTQKARIKTWAFDNDSINYKFDFCRLYRQDVNTNYSITIPVNYDVHNISINRNYIDIKYNELYDTLDFLLSSSDEPKLKFELQGFLFKNPTKGISYHGAGVNGAGVKSYLRCKQLVNQLEDLTPNLVIIGLGLNDTYKENGAFDSNSFFQDYDKLIKIIKSKRPDVSILLMTNNDSYYKRKEVNTNSIDFNRVIEEIASKYQCSVWDLFGIMGGINSIKQWEDKGLAKPDLIHLTDKGYDLQAKLLFNALVSDYEQK